MPENKIFGQMQSVISVFVDPVAWPAIYEELDLPVSYASIVSMLISGGTVISSLLSVRLVARLGTDLSKYDISNS